MTGRATLVVIAFGDPNLVRNLLASLAGHADADRLDGIIVVDNGFPESSDSRGLTLPPGLSVPLLVIPNRSRSYASGVNLGVAAASAPVVLVSNNDVLWHPRFTVEPLLAALETTPLAAAAGPQLLFPDGSWQRSHGSLPSVANRLREILLRDLIAHYWQARRFRPDARPPGRRLKGYIDGAFFAVRRAAFDKLGGYDESYTFYGEDVEFAWQAQSRDYWLLFVPSARVIHLRGAASAPRTNTEYLTRLHQAKIRFVARHYGQRHARLYRRLTWLLAMELRLVYRVAALVAPGPRAERRRLAAELAFEALRALPADVFATEPA